MKDELFYEAESKTARPIKYKQDDAIYPTMVIRSQAETIELQEKEIERLNNIIDGLEKYLNEEIEDYNEALNSKLLSESGKEKYEAEKVCFLDMLDKLNELKGDNK